MYASTGTLAVERRLAERVIADARQARLTGIGLVAAEPLGQHVADLEVLGLLRRTEGQEQLRVHAQRAGLQAEADQQRGALGQPGIDAPGAPAPRAAGRLARRLCRSEPDRSGPTRCRSPGSSASPCLAVELAEHRHFRRELGAESAARRSASPAPDSARSSRVAWSRASLIHQPFRPVEPGIDPGPARPPRTDRSRSRNRVRPTCDRDRTAPLRVPLAGRRRHRRSTNHRCRRSLPVRYPRRWRPSSKIRGSGFATPTTLESMTNSRCAPSPAIVERSLHRAVGVRDDSNDESQVARAAGGPSPLRRPPGDRDRSAR